MIRGTKRNLSPEIVHKVEKTMEASIHNRFDIEVVDSVTGEVKQRAYAENIILDQMWSKLFANTVWNQRIHYGSGTGTLSASRTSLFNFVGSTYSSKDGSTTKRGLFSYRKKSVIAESEAVGVTITEVGIAYGAASGNLCTHAMLKDMNGNQISIAKTNTDVINLYATVFVHYNPEGYNGVHMNNFSRCSESYGDVYGFFMYLTQGWCNQQAMLPTYLLFSCSNQITSGMLFTNLNATNVDLATKTVTFTATRLAAGTGNTQDNKSVLIISGLYDNRYGVGFMRVGDVWTAGFPVVGEAIGTGNGSTKDFQTKFPEVSGMKLYADGVEIASGFTVDENLPFMVANTSPPHNNVMFNRLSVDSDGAIYYDNQDITNVSSYQYLNANQTIVYENSWYERMGLGSVCIGVNVTVLFSNDGVSWTPAPVGINTGSLVDVPEAYKHYRYIKGTSSSISQRFELGLERASNLNIHFTTPPASGAVITADYTTKSIPKDSNHVFDFSCAIHFGERIV